MTDLLDKLPLTPETERILAEAIAVYGEDAQTDMMVEECAELIKAIQHHKRGINSEGNLEFFLFDELADVMIMSWQLMLLWGPEHVCERMVAKLARLQDRLEAHKHTVRVARNILGPLMFDPDDED